MGSVRLGVGTEWLLDGRLFRIVRQPAADRFVVLDLKFQHEQTLAESEILDKYAQGELRFAPPNANLEENSDPAPVRTLDTLSGKEDRELQRRWTAIEPLTKLPHNPTADEYRVRSEELRRLGQPCAPRTLRRYYNTWKRAGKDRTALIPRTIRRGNRGTTRRNSLLARSGVLRQLVDDAISGLYLTRARHPVAAVTRRVLDDLARRNARLPADQAVPLPKPSTLNRAICRRINRLDPWEVDRARWGRLIADRRHKPTTRQRLAERILQRVEIDHSPLKVVVGTEAGPIGQPWLTVLIDYYSRMITGFCLGFEPPSYGVLMEALRRAILPKTYLSEKFPRVQGEWPCFGLPEKLVCDRGADLTSNDLEQAAFQLGIELDFNPPRTPHFKGTVESFFDTLNDQLLSGLPGRTFRSWERRADYDPDTGPLIPYDALMEIVHMHLVDVYAISRHPTAPHSRQEVWQAGALEFPPCLPGSPEELVILLARSAERTLSSRGIELAGMHYLSDELMALRGDLAAANLAGNRLQLRYNPWDLGEVWVLDPITRTYLRVAAVDPVMVGMTEYQWRVLKRAVREKFDEPEHLVSLSAGRNAIREVVESTLVKPSRRRRRRAARFVQRPDQTGQASQAGHAGQAGQAGQPRALPEDEWREVPGTAPDATVPSEPSPSPPPPVDPRPDSTPATPTAEDSPTIDPDDLDVDDWEVAT
ncbi:MAG: hypothetical protein CMJ48_08100 [Planctomycetaceae bacterium]|nr:hypothetical protein [Planctomycetaceae bacterium]